MSLKGKTDIFDSPSQLLEIDPATIRLLSDRCLIRDLGDPERVGSIIIPEVAREKVMHEWGLLRIGEVVATGPGDRFIELGWDDYSGVRRKLITMRCGCTAHPALNMWGEDIFGRKPGKRYRFDIVEYRMVELPDGVPCPRCDGSGRVPITIPPQCRPGERVLYSRRREAEVYLEGVRYSLLNSEQSILAVLED
jgi:co-chaperonin GroES (HSP10)